MNVIVIHAQFTSDKVLHGAFGHANTQDNVPHKNFQQRSATTPLQDNNKTTIFKRRGKSRIQDAIHPTNVWEKKKVKKQRRLPDTQRESHPSNKCYDPCLHPSCLFSSLTNNIPQILNSLLSKTFTKRQGNNERSA